jgi:hypothetical protein
MPVFKKKQACTQADGDKGTYTLYHKTKNGKKKKVACASSKEKANAYISGSYADWDWKKNENISFEEIIYKRLLEYFEKEYNLIN